MYENVVLSFYVNSLDIIMKNRYTIIFHFKHKEQHKNRQSELY